MNDNKEYTYSMSFSLPTVGAHHLSGYVPGTMKVNGQPVDDAKAPKRKKQPTADAMRAQLVLAADEIIRLRGVILAINTTASRSWWRRIFR